MGLTALLFLQISYQAQFCAELKHFTTLHSPEFPFTVSPGTLRLGSPPVCSNLEETFWNILLFQLLLAFVIVKSPVPPELVLLGQAQNWSVYEAKWRTHMLLEWRCVVEELLELKRIVNKSSVIQLWELASLCRANHS